MQSDKEQDSPDDKRDSQGVQRGQVARKAGLVGLLTLASRVLGLVRDAVVAAMFHKGSTSAFFVAFTIPNVLRRLLAEGALTVAFVPVFTDYKRHKGDAEARAMAANTLGVSLVVLVVVTILGIVFSPWIVRLFADGLEAKGRLGLTIDLTRVVFPYVVTVGLVALAMGVLNTLGHFSAPAAAPLLLNIGIIGSALLLRDVVVGRGYPQVGTLAVGVLIGGVFQLILQLPALSKRKMLLRPRFDARHPGVVRVARMMLPSLFGLAIYQVNIILSRRFASYLDDVGSISYLYYAQRLIEFPVGIFAVAIATVALPNLSAHAQRNELDDVKATYRYALRVALFVMLPAAAGLIALALPLSAVLFQRGAFDHAMAQQTAITVVGFATGLWASAGVKQTAPVFFAFEDTRTPVVASTIALVVYIIAAWSLYRDYHTFGLAIAVAISSAVNFIVLLAILRARYGKLGMSDVALSSTRSLIGSLGAGFAAWFVAKLGDWQAGVTVANLAVLFGAVAAGGVAYVAVAALLRSAELRELWGAVRRKIK
jgi:putative peptidoglycan lipid II flippase